MRYPDGSKYEGELVKGKKSGHGTRFWASGDRYIGQFKDNQMSGTGVYYSMADQTKRQGEWLNGKRVSWLTAPQATHVSIDEVNRDSNTYATGRNALYRGGKWRDVGEKLTRPKAAIAARTAAKFRIAANIGTAERKEAKLDMLADISAI